MESEPIERPVRIADRQLIQNAVSAQTPIQPIPDCTMAKKSKTRKKTTKKRYSTQKVDATGKHLVIVESPSKAKNINQYLGSDYIVRASVGHVRDLPSKAPKGSKQPVPGVDLENDFEPTYEIMAGKKSAIADLKRMAKKAIDVWFATDLDREGEAIAWHLAQEMGIPSAEAKRVVFNAVTKRAIQEAFQNPHYIDDHRVNAQQARRILDRIVGYQVSPLLWKKVARGLSAGRVQSVAVRLVVDREREIRAFIPDEYWALTARLTTKLDKASSYAAIWSDFMTTLDAKSNSPTLKMQNAWLAQHHAIKAELIEVDGKKPQIVNADQAEKIAKRAGMQITDRIETTNDKAKGPAKNVVKFEGICQTDADFAIKSIETKQTKSRPAAPFITSTLQQAASTRLGFGARRTMQTAQRLYEGIDLPGRGTVGLITYMRTDSTHLSPEAIDSARSYIQDSFGDTYLPDKPRRFASSNKAAQEAHEAIRPTSVHLHPDEISSHLDPAQAKLYRIIWQRFVACQMADAAWNLTTIKSAPQHDSAVVFRTTGRVLTFDGFYRVTGVPTASDEQTLPDDLAEGQSVRPFSIEPLQKFTSPPPRFTEASLVKTLEEEGIGRPSTYAEIIQKIQDRKYVEQRERRFHATDLGEVVTDKLVEAFPNILSVGFTKEMEIELDRVEANDLEWKTVLHHFYTPFKERLDLAHETLSHAKAETQPAPHKCPDCKSGTVYRFGKNGRFLSCASYPDCKYASPIDTEGNPVEAEVVDVACLKCGSAMQKKTGRFGPFLGCTGYPECDGIIKLDKKTGRPVATQPPPLKTDIPCPKCEEPLNLRSGARGPWLSCSKFPKCRGRGAWSKLEDDVRDRWAKALEEHEALHPIPIVKTMDGTALTDAKGKPLVSEPQGAYS